MLLSLLAILYSVIGSDGTSHTLERLDTMSEPRALGQVGNGLAYELLVVEDMRRPHFHPVLNPAFVIGLKNEVLDLLFFGDA